MNGLDCLKSYLDALLAFSVAFQTQFWDFSGVIHIFGLHEWIKCFLYKKLIDLSMKNCLQCSMDIHPCVETEIEKRDFLQHYYWHVCCIPYLHFSFWDIPEFSIIDWRHIHMPCLKFKNTFFPMHDACLLWSLQKRKCAILGFYDLNKTDGLENLTLGF